MAGCISAAMNASGIKCRTTSGLFLSMPRVNTASGRCSGTRRSARVYRPMRWCRRGAITACWMPRAIVGMAGILSAPYYLDLMFPSRLHHAFDPADPVHLRQTAQANLIADSSLHSEREALEWYEHRTHLLASNITENPRGAAATANCSAPRRVCGVNWSAKRSSTRGYGADCRASPIDSGSKRFRSA